LPNLGGARPCRLRVSDDNKKDRHNIRPGRKTATSILALAPSHIRFRSQRLIYSEVCEMTILLRNVVSVTWAESGVTQRFVEI
jgi:hypothetical protein